MTEAKAYAQQRQTFGKPLGAHQVIHRKLVDMAQRIEAPHADLELTVLKMDPGLDSIADVCLLKNQVTQTRAHFASEAARATRAAPSSSGSIATSNRMSSTGEASRS